MRMKHILLEGYCNFDIPNNSYPCNSKKGKMGLHCIGCEQFSYTEAPNELALSNKDSVIEKLDDFIAPEFEIEYKGCIKRWNKICRVKIQEAYDEFIKMK